MSRQKEHRKCDMIEIQKRAEDFSPEFTEYHMDYLGAHFERYHILDSYVSLNNDPEGI